MNTTIPDDGLSALDAILAEEARRGDAQVIEQPREIPVEVLHEQPLDGLDAPQDAAGATITNLPERPLEEETAPAGEAKKAFRFRLLGLVLSDAKVAWLEQSSNAKAAGREVATKKIYEAREAKVAASIEQLERYGGAFATTREEFEAALAAAKEKAKEGDYAAAQKQLKTIHPTKVLHNAEIDYQYKGVRAKNDKGTVPCYTLADKLLATLRAADTPLPIKSVNYYVSAVTSQLRRLMDDKKRDGLIDDVLNGLNSIEIDIAESTNSAKTARDEVRAAFQDGITQLRNLEAQRGDWEGMPSESATTFEEKLTELGIDLAAAESAIAVRDWTRAKQVFDLFAPKLLAATTMLPETLAAAETFAREWADSAVREKWLNCCEFVKGFQPNPHARQIPNRLKQLQLELNSVNADTGLMPRKDGRATEELVRQAYAELEALEEFSEGIEQLIEAFETAFAKVQVAIDGLATKLNGGPAVNEPFVQRLNAIRTAFEPRLSAALSLSDVDASGFLEALTKIEQDVAALDQPASMLAAQDRVRLKATVATAEQACNDLTNSDIQLGATAHGELRGLIAAADEKAGTENFAAALNTVEEFAERTIARVDDRKKERLRCEDLLKAELAALGPDVAKFRTAAEKAKGTSGPQQLAFETVKADIEADYDALTAMADQSSAALLLAAVEDAKAFRKKLDGAATFLTGNASEGHLSYKDAVKRLSNANDLIGTAVAKTYAGIDQATLAGEIKDLLANPGALAPDALAEKVEELQTRAAAIATSASELKEKVEAFGKATLKPLRTNLKEISSLAPRYAAALLERVDGLTALYIKQAQEPKAEVSALQNEIRLASGDFGNLPEKENATARADAAQVEDSVVWRTEVKILRKKIEALEWVNKREADVLHDLLDATEEDINQSKKFGEGRKTLGTIETRIKAVNANPLGLVIASRNKLPHVKARVGRAIEQFTGGLQALAKEIGGTDLDENDKPAVEATIADLRSVLLSADYATAVDQVAKREAGGDRNAKQADQQKRSGEREKALREIRRLLKFVNDDGRMKLLAGAPFAVQLQPALAELNLALLDLENNLLVSL